MTSFQETAQQSPWISVWLRPRLTIERIIAERQQRFVLLLTALRMIASLTSSLVGAGLTSQLFDWRVLLGLVFAGAALGMVALYAGVFVFKWIGGLLGGHASTAELRAVFAWSMMPSILGLMIVAAICVASTLRGGGIDGQHRLLLQSILDIGIFGRSLFFY